MKIVAIIQARMSSSRLPGKVMMEVNNAPLINLLVKRLRKSKILDQVVVASTTSQEDNILVKNLKKNNILYFRGSENDVLGRYFLAAKKFSAKIIVRITSDCPLADPELIDEALEIFLAKRLNFLSNNYPPTFPDGMDIEIFDFNTLKDANSKAVKVHDREHVTPFMLKSRKYKKYNIRHKTDLSKYRWTVDELVDYQMIKKIFNSFQNIYFGWQEILSLEKNDKSFFISNMHISRNEGHFMGKGQKLWKRAKTVIPGGNMLLSKRSEMFIPNIWPSYFTKTKDFYVWDLDNNKYADVGMMGVGTNILGYSNKDVDSAVINIVRNGNLSTLNCPEEVFLAEKLVDMHPWAGSVKFTRSGGEANALAIRIGRAASGKDNVAFCGYHGWHDWYLSANIKTTKNLESHLLNGLEPNGVPKNLKNTVFPFEYNNFEQLESLIKNNNIGVIKMEVSRNIRPKNSFLQKIRKIATLNKIVLIFDECTSGFRETFGGLHLKYKVEPDIAVFGKTLGNGYAINAIVGRSEVMEAAQTTFISSTFWTERIGPAAALKTLEIMEKSKSWEVVTSKGEYMVLKIKELGKKHNLKLSVFGLPSMLNYKIDHPKWLFIKTFISIEMLKRNILATNIINMSIKHHERILNKYLEHLDECFYIIKQYIDKDEVERLISSPPCHDTFKRLN
jgi:glutamate-1-semialdehyde 2,1-aminomutase